MFWRENCSHASHLRCPRLNYLPDEELMEKLEQERGKGRDDYLIRAVWNSILAGIVY